jgi:hypothetical protein
MVMKKVATLFLYFNIQQGNFLLGLGLRNSNYVIFLF